MSTVTAAQHPADRPAARWMLDVLLTVGAALSVLPPLLSESPQHPAWQMVLAALLSAPLLVRRIWPVEVFAFLLAAAIGLQIWDRHAVCGVAMLIALYTIAERCSRRAALTATATLEAGVIVTAVRLAGTNWWYDTIFLTGMLGAALGLGLYAATRRAYLTELRERAQQLERERDQQGALAAAAERARIAREMHHIVAHNLTVIVRLSDAAIAASATSPQQAAEVMRSVSATGRRALDDTRRLLGVLRHGGADSSDEFAPLPDLAELDGLVAQVRSAGLPTSLEIHGVTGHVPTGMQLTVYRLVQEALTNTLKHAGPNVRAAVRLNYRPGELDVEVEDDGAGAQTPAAVGAGGGLVGMYERVHAYGGDVHSGPRQPAGWRVSAQLKYDDSDSG